MYASPDVADVYFVVGYALKGRRSTITRSKKRTNCLRNSGVSEKNGIKAPPGRNVRTSVGTNASHNASSSQSDGGKAGSKKIPSKLASGIDCTYAKMSACTISSDAGTCGLRS